MWSQVLHIKLDDPLQKIFGEERLALRRVSERLSEMATEEQPIEIVYSLKLHGEAKPLVYEALVQVQDPVMTHMRELVQVCRLAHFLSRAITSLLNGHLSRLR